MNREDWLTLTGQSLAAEFQLPLTRPWRVAPTAPKGSVLGMCYAARASADGANELYISVSIVDPTKLAVVLLHELIHATDDNARGHKTPLFKSVGFMPPIAQYNPAPALVERVESLLTLLPACPVVPMATPPKTQGRMVKISCHVCGWKVHTTRKQALALPVPAYCPVCTMPSLAAEE